MVRKASTGARARPTLPGPPQELHAALLAWYDCARRELPWRSPPGVSPDPYRVLVSEIMLQQTTVATVRGRFADFVARFPDLQALAAAPVDDVLHAWQGLGYYRRARALHAAAVATVELHGGDLPRDLAALQRLPGLGPYTAAAVAAIAFGLPAVPVDGNVARVLARLAAIEMALPQALPALRNLAAALAGAQRPGDFAQALMELGALVCRPRNPACLECPWRHACRGLAGGIALELPRRVLAAVRPERFTVAFLLQRGDGAILFRRRPEPGLLGGMVELPSSDWQPSQPSLDEALQHAPAPAEWKPVPGTVRHLFTHLALNATVLTGSAAGSPPGLWATRERFPELILPTFTRRLLAHAGAG